MKLSRFSFWDIRFWLCLLASAAMGMAEAPADYTTPYAFQTLAGLSSIGSTDGPAKAARFFWPMGLAVDQSGNIYVAEHGGDTIRKITPAGVVSTLAGTPGLEGSSDGTGSDALFGQPQGLAVDSDGNIYVADYINSTIRKVTSDGMVTTLAGSPGVTGSTDGHGSGARFNIPSDLTVDSSGNIWVADTQNNTIRKITPAGDVTTVAGTAGVLGTTDGTGAAAKFFYPIAITLDSSGNLLVAEAGLGTVRRVTPAGVVTTIVPVSASLGSLHGITQDPAGNIYVSDWHHVVHKITPDGTIMSLAGTERTPGSTDGNVTEALFNRPFGLASDSAGNVYVADSYNNTIRKITPSGEVSTVAGLAPEESTGSSDGTLALARFNDLGNAALGSDGAIYVADTINSTVRKISPDGTVSTIAGKAGERGATDGPGDEARFDSPYGIAVDSTGQIYVSDPVYNTIRRISTTGEVSTLAGDPTASSGSTDGSGSAARFNYPTGLAFDSAGNLYVADRDNYTIRKISSDGSVTTLAGSAGNAGNIDGTGNNARFQAPEGIAVGPDNMIYVSDAVRHGAIRKVSPTGVVTTLAGGSGGDLDSVDGTGTEARFNKPEALAVDTAGNVYVADTGNHTVRKVTPDGVVSTLGGLASAAGSADGAGIKSRFMSPPGICVNAENQLYVTSGTTIREGQLATAPIITTQPATQSVETGSRAQFSVAASGAPSPTYQWYHSDQLISGATEDTLVLASVSSSDAGDYTVLVSNSLGSVTSDKATLTVTTSSTSGGGSTSGSGSTGGGGGAPSMWFLGIIAALSLARWWSTKATHLPQRE